MSTPYHLKNNLCDRFGPGVPLCVLTIPGQQASQLDQLIVAFMTDAPSLTRENLTAACHAVPRILFPDAILEITEIPRGPLGKIARR